MNAKEFLQQVRTIDIIIDNKREEIRKLRSMIEISAVKYEGCKTQSSGNHDKTANIICRIVDLENEINIEIEKLLNAKQEIMNVIDKINDPEMIDLLYRRYIHFEKWEKIAYKMNYSLRGIYKLHGRALQEIEKKLKCAL